MNNRHRWLPLFGILVSFFSSGVLFSADTTPTKYELYSWKKGNDWYYSLVPAPATGKAAVEIKSAGGPLHGASQVKEHILKMPEGEVISWQERANSGMTYPPDEVMEDLHDYAESVGVTLDTPKSADAKKL